MNYPQRIKKLYRRAGWKGFAYALKNRLVANSLWDRYNQEALICAGWMDYSGLDLELSRQIHQDLPGELPIRSVTWFIPDFSNPFYGGIHTILLFAAHLAEKRGVSHQFAVLGKTPERKIREYFTSISPVLQNARIRIITSPDQIKALEPADAGICTLWATAYHLLIYNQVRRKFYFLQDDESLFYPAGTISALVQGTYKFGFVGLANTPPVAEHYHRYSDQKTVTFLPGIDRTIFFPADLLQEKKPQRIFWYARPEHPRNGFELCAQALLRVKAALGENVEILAAGDDWDPARYRLKDVVKNLGRLSYPETARLYRSCQLGLVMMFTAHPSYIPIQLMACGCPVVTNSNPETGWLLQDGTTCISSAASATSLSNKILAVLSDANMRFGLAERGLKFVQERFSPWDKQFELLFFHMQQPLDVPCE